MCKDKSSTLASTPRSRLRPPSVPTSANLASRTTGTATTASSNLKPSTSSSTSSSRISLASLQGSLPDRPILYQINEIRRATNNFVSGRLSSSSSASSWRCNLRGKDVVLVQREFTGDPAGVGERLSSVCRSNHIGLVKLLGVCVNGGDSIFLVYEDVKGATLADCLRNKKNPNFSPISSWLSRMQVADDVAQGLEYIHQYRSGSHHRQPVHNWITSGNILVTEADLRGKICHVGTSELTGEMDREEEGSRSGSKQGKRTTNGEIEEEETNKDRDERIHRNRRMKFKGTRGYIAPEVVAGAYPSQKTDVFAFGVVLLEILTGEEPIHHRNNMDRLESVSLIDTARDVMGSDEGEWEDEEKRRRLRRWADRRLKDSFPVDVAEKVLEVALECVGSDAVRRPDMVRVAGKLSQCLITSLRWANNMKVPLDFSITNTPR